MKCNFEIIIFQTILTSQNWKTKRLIIPESVHESEYFIESLVVHGENLNLLLNLNNMLMRIFPICI